MNTIIIKTKREEKKNDLIVSFIKVFSEEGLDGSSIKKLAAQANVPESLIYRYFDNKNDVISQCVDYYHGKIQAELVAIFSENVKDIDLLSLNILTYMDTVIDICRFLLQVMAHPVYYKMMTDSSKQVEANILDFASILQEAFNLEQHLAKGMAQLLNSTVNDYILKKSKENFTLQVNAIFTTISNL